MWNWLWGRSVPGRDIVLYTRAGCHLCEEAWAVLENAQRQFSFALRQVDVDTDPALAEQYGLEIPVVLVDGQVRFRGRVNAVLLRRLLRSRSRDQG